MLWTRIWLGACLLVCGLLSPALQAAEPALASDLRESVVMVKTDGGLLLSEYLETTIFRPQGNGPFPIVIINHGKAAGLAKLQPRARFESVARVLIEKGFMVVVPMRQGFARSTGAFAAGGLFSTCNPSVIGQDQADDIQAVIQYLRGLADADTKQMIVMGQSHGGLTTLALGTRRIEGIKYLFNFAGGWSNNLCRNYEQSLIQAMRDYGSKINIPSVWFYGDNDSFWSQTLYRDMFKAFTQAGAPARLVEFGKFSEDAHLMFGARDGIRLWLNDFMQATIDMGLTPSQ